MKYDLWINSFNRIKNKSEGIIDFNNFNYQTLDDYLKHNQNKISDYNIFALGLTEFMLTDEMLEYIMNLSDFSFYNLCGCKINYANLNKMADYIIKNNCGGEKLVYILFNRKLSFKNMFLDNKEIIHSNIQSGDFSYLSVLDKDTFDLFYRSNYIKFLKHTNIHGIKRIFENDLLDETEINSKEFINVFKTYSLKIKLGIIEILKNNEINNDIIEKLVDLAILDKSDNIYENNFTMYKSDFEFIAKEILNSSYVYYKEYNEDEKKLLEIIEKLNETDEFTYNKTNVDNLPNLGNIKYYKNLKNLHEKCIKYSKESILNSLYNLESLPDLTNEFGPNNKYNILVANSETTDPITYNSNQQQIFENFTIINQDNFCTQQHISSYNQIYGYYTGIKENDIINISPFRQEFNVNAKKKNQVFFPGITGIEINTSASTTKPSYWWTINDLNNYLYETSMYGTIIIKARNNGQVLKPNVKIIMDRPISEYDINEAKEKNIKILKLNKNKKTKIHALEPNSTHHNG